MNRPKKMTSQTNAGIARTPSPTGVPATRADFLDCVDRCVSALIAPSPGSATSGAVAQLRRWLGDGQTRLADGTQLDYGLFDEAILGVDERMAMTHCLMQRALVSATRQLAESIYAKA